MNRYARPIDGSVPVKALLYADEELVASQDNVGLYDGKDKSLEHQVGTCHITTHRLFYIDSALSRSSSLAFNLASVRRTEYYAGFLTSSAKVTLILGPQPSAAIETSEDDDTIASSSASAAPPPPAVQQFFIEAWICPICSYSNPPSANEGKPKCHLCGMTRQGPIPTTIRSPPPPPVIASPIPTLAPPRPHEPGLSQSLPSSPTAFDSATSFAAAVPPPPPANDPISCPTCTFLNHPSMRLCEICSTPLKRPSTTNRTVGTLASPSKAAVQTAPPSRASTPGVPDSIKISFRKGGDRPFYAVLKKVLQGKAWEGSAAEGWSTSSTAVSGTSGAFSGISGIMRAAKSTARVQGQHLDSSLRDLEALMSKAKEMVQIAESLNEKLTAQEELQARQKALHPEYFPASSSSSAQSEEATFIRTSMARLGLQSMAVTQDMVKDEREYHEELAKELAGVLLGPPSSKSKTADGEVIGGLMKQNNGIIGLDEVWCAWNRARGVALIPPSSFMAVIPHLSRLTSPTVHQRTFKSGLRVLHTPSYAHEAFAARLITLLSSTGSKTSIEIARDERMSVGLAEQMMEAVEEEANVVRDEPGGYDPVRWYPNEFKNLLTYDGTC